MSKPVELYTPAPDLVLTDFEGNEIRLPEFPEEKGMSCWSSTAAPYGHSANGTRPQLHQDYSKFNPQEIVSIVGWPEGSDDFKLF